jgi:hypothetical protein
MHDNFTRDREEDRSDCSRAHVAACTVRRMQAATSGERTNYAALTSGDAAARIPASSGGAGHRKLVATKRDSLVSSGFTA